MPATKADEQINWLEGLETKPEGSKFPVDEATFEDNSARTFIVGKPEKLGHAEFESVLQSLSEIKDIKQLPMEMPPTANPVLIEKIKELSAIRAAEGIVQKEHILGGVDINITAALKSAHINLEGYPTAAERTSLRLMEAAMQGFEASLETAIVAPADRDKIHEQLEAIVVKAVSNKVVAHLAAAENPDFQWPTDADGRKLLNTAEEIQQIPANSKNRDAILQAELQNLAADMLEAVRDYNIKADSQAGIEIDPRSAKMARLLMNKERYSEIEQAAKAFNESLIDTTVKSTPFEFGSGGVVRGSKVTSLGFVEKDVEITSISKQAYVENFIAGFGITCLINSEPGDNKVFKAYAENFKRTATEYLNSNKTDEILGTFAEMAANFNERHFIEGIPDAYAKEVGEITNEDFLRLSVAVMGKEIALKLNPNYRFETESPLNKLPDFGVDIDEDRAFQFAQGVEMLRQAINARYDRAADKSPEQIEERAKNMSYAFLNAIMALKRCDNAGLTTIPRFKNSDEQWVLKDLNAIPTKKSKK